jgi:hypothetical protein
MKKGIFITGCIVIVVAIALISVFLLSTSAPEVEAVDLTGIWKVYRHGGDLIDNEYMVFEGKQVTDYRDGVEEPFLSAAYMLSDGTTLRMEDIGKEFVVRQVSENNVNLVEPNTVEWKMFRVTVNGVQPADFNRETIIGKWTVVMHAGQAKTDEIMEFTDTAMADYRSEELYIEGEYVWNEDGTFEVPVIGHTFAPYMADEDTIILHDLTDGYLWELKRAK